jgi:hypothetical protein
MSLLGERSASFIVRIWRERSEGLDATVEWRGSIECVDGGEKVYFRDLNVIGSFLKTHLQRIGIDAWQEDAGSGIDLHRGGSSQTHQPKKKRRRR